MSDEWRYWLERHEPASDDELRIIRKYWPRLQHAPVTFLGKWGPVESSDEMRQLIADMVAELYPTSEPDND